MSKQKFKVGDKVKVRGRRQVAIVDAVEKEAVHVRFRSGERAVMYSNHVRHHPSRPNKKTREAIAESRELKVGDSVAWGTGITGRIVFMDRVDAKVERDEGWFAWVPKRQLSIAPTPRKPVRMVRVGWMVKGKFKGAKTWDVGFHTVRELAIENLRTEVLYAPDGSWGDEWYVQGPITAIYARKEGSKK